MPEANWVIPCPITHKLFLRYVRLTIFHNLGTKGIHTEAHTYSEASHETWPMTKNQEWKYRDYADYDKNHRKMYMGPYTLPQS